MAQRPGPDACFDVPRLLTHPVVVLAIALWWLNDHVLKAAFGNALTGKLSDVTGLIATPAVLLGLLWLFGVRPGRRLAGTLAAATAFGLAAINLSEAAADSYRGAFALAFGAFAHGVDLLGGAPLRFGEAQLTMDPSDLFTLPAALVTPCIAERQAQGDRRPSSSRERRTTGRLRRTSRREQASPTDG
ncbi:MAG: hypothetical protein AAF447_00495 [Myxococcota bacterium]